jgi:hypothetical protein
MKVLRSVLALVLVFCAVVSASVVRADETAAAVVSAAPQKEKIMVYSDLGDFVTFYGYGTLGHPEWATRDNLWQGYAVMEVPTPELGLKDHFNALAMNGLRTRYPDKDFVLVARDEALPRDQKYEGSFFSLKADTKKSPVARWLLSKAADMGAARVICITMPQYSTSNGTIETYWPGGYGVVAPPRAFGMSFSKKSNMNVYISTITMDVASGKVSNQTWPKMGLMKAAAGVGVGEPMVLDVSSDAAVRASAHAVGEALKPVVEPILRRVVGDIKLGE